METNANWTEAQNLYEASGFKFTHSAPGEFGRESFYELRISLTPNAHTGMATRTLGEQAARYPVQLQLSSLASDRDSRSQFR